MEPKKEIFRCDCCNYETNMTSFWLRHCETAKHKRNGQKKQHICEVCDYETTGIWNLKAHMLSQHSTPEERSKQKYYCKDCDQVFFSPVYYEKHMAGIKHANYVKAIEELKKVQSYVKKNKGQ